MASPTSTAGRRALAGKRKAMPGGRYPIPNVGFLKKAMRAIGRTPPAKRPAVRAFIKTRAKALGATKLLKSPVWSMSNAELVDMLSFELTHMVESDLELAGTTPVVGASDGPRVMKSSLVGLQPHQVKAYARMRKRGVKHQTALTFARRVDTRANTMGTAAKIGSGTGSQAYSRGSTGSRVGIAGTASTSAKGQIKSGRKAKKGVPTNQVSVFSPQITTPGNSKGGNSEAAKRKARVVTSAVPKLRQQSGTPPGGKLLKVSAGKYGNWPNYKGKSVVPPTPVSTYPGKQTPVTVATLMDENANSVRVNASARQRKYQPPSRSAQHVGNLPVKGQKAYGALRQKGISHSTAMRVVGQYYGSGKTKNSLGLRKGGNLTNLRMRQSAGRGASTPAPKGR